MLPPKNIVFGGATYNDPFKCNINSIAIQNEMWKKSYNLNYNQTQNNNFQNENDKINIVFRLSSGKLCNILFDPERTVEDLILTFFRRIGREELMEKGGVAFVHNALQFDYHTKDKVKNFFKFNMNPTIMVLDLYQLFGA